MLRAPGNVILEVGPHLVSAMLDLVGKPEHLSVTADREITLPGGARIFRRWRIHATVGRTAVDININFGPGFAKERSMFAAKTDPPCSTLTPTLAPSIDALLEFRLGSLQSKPFARPTN